MEQLCAAIQGLVQQNSTFIQIQQHHNSLTEAALHVLNSSSHDSTGNVMLQAMRHFRLPAFSGDKDSEDLDTWLFMVNEFFHTLPAKVDDVQKIRFAGLQLKGQAASWYRDISTRTQDQLPHTWDDFVREMKLVFMPVGRNMLAREKLAHAKQFPGQSVATYTAYMRKLFLAIPDIQTTDFEKKDRYMRGLVPSLRKEVTLQDPSTFDDAVKIATKYGMIRDIYSYEKYHSPRVDGNTGHSSHGPTPMEIGMVAKRKPSFAHDVHDRVNLHARPHREPLPNVVPTKVCASRSTQAPVHNVHGHTNGTSKAAMKRHVTCWNCGEHGHYSYECPQTRMLKQFPKRYA